LSSSIFGGGVGLASCAMTEEEKAKVNAKIATKFESFTFLPQ
jgi:hypothetical protein